MQGVSFEVAYCQHESIAYVGNHLRSMESIVANDQQHTITTSLAKSLRRFRLPPKPCALWADAICINQKNHVEKSNLVTRIGEIYQKARRILC